MVRSSEENTEEWEVTAMTMAFFNVALENNIGNYINE
jgi:hypothetical protein